MPENRVFVYDYNKTGPTWRFVIVEFSDNGRSNCPGTGDVTCTTKIGTVVKAFDAHISEATQTFMKLRAHVIISSQTPNNPCESGTFSYGAGRLVSGAPLAVKNVMLPWRSLAVCCKCLYSKALGKETVDEFHPNDHTHTSPTGADVVSKAFVKCVVCGNIQLKNYFKNEMSTNYDSRSLYLVE